MIFAAFRGAAAGVLVSGVVLLIELIVWLGLSDPSGPQSFGLLVLGVFLYALVAGPGAFILAIPVSLWLSSYSARAPSPRRVYLAGALVGLPIGYVNRFLVALLFDGRQAYTVLLRPWEGILYLAPALLGGVTLGLVVAASTLRKRRVEGRP